MLELQIIDRKILKFGGIISLKIGYVKNVLSSGL